MAGGSPQVTRRGVGDVVVATQGMVQAGGLRARGRPAHHAVSAACLVHHAGVGARTYHAGAGLCREAQGWSDPRDGHPLSHSYFTPGRLWASSQENPFPSLLLLPGDRAEPEAPDLPHQCCSQGQGLAGAGILSTRELMTLRPQARPWPELWHAGGAEVQLQQRSAGLSPLGAAGPAGPAAARRCLGREAAATAARLAAAVLAPARGKGRVTLEQPQHWNEGARGWREPAQQDQSPHRALLGWVEARAPPLSLHSHLFP